MTTSPASSLRPTTTEDNEESRAFLQSRLALFWKVMFLIIFFSSGLGALGAVGEPGLDLWLTLASAAQCGLFWWLCRRGERSVRSSRALESSGLILNAALGALIGRFIFAGFAADRGIATAEGALMADGYVTMLQIAGMTMLLAIRAALVPSAPRRTAGISALFGVPAILATTFVVPVAGGGLALRDLDGGALPWLPAMIVMMWGYAVVTCTVISWVIYGLRQEVREARRLGQYELEEKLGEGGMGEVYRARHGMMRRPTAIKLLRGDRAGAMDLQRFEREVQLTARLTHPNTITIFDYGRTHDGVFYYAMELLDGATLQSIVAIDGAQHAGRVVRILTMVCGALAEAHAIGLIHRDIKPANIMLCRQGGEDDVVKLLDFGLVKESAIDQGVELTGANTILGTPLYMAPESIKDPSTVDVRTDIYAVGAVAYLLLAGTDVFDGTPVIAVCGQHLHEEPQPLSERGIVLPAELEAIVLACLEKDPENRPQTAEELRRRLEACAVEPWDAERAHAWWREHRARLERDAALRAGDAQTVPADGVSRSSTVVPARV